jgi:hypothetical protein
MLGGWIDSFPAPLRKSIFCGCTVVSWTIWKTRNDACFDRKFPDDPSSSIYRTGLFCRKTKTEEDLKMVRFCWGEWRVKCTQGYMDGLLQRSELWVEAVLSWFSLDLEIVL